MKRILVVAVAAILAWCGFTFFSNHAGAEAHDAEHGHEQEHEEGDFDNIPLSQKQVDAVDLKMGEAVDRVRCYDCSQRSARFARPEQGRCGFAHGGRGEGYLCKRRTECEARTDCGFG